MDNCTTERQIDRQLDTQNKYIAGQTDRQTNSWSVIYVVYIYVSIVCDIFLAIGYLWAASE